MKTYYVEWSCEGTNIGKAVVPAKDIADAIEQVTIMCDEAKFTNITVAGEIRGVKVMTDGRQK